MSVLDRAALEESPLADLHALASELGIDGFRRLRKADLVNTILEAQGGDGASAPAPAPPAGTDDVEEEAATDEPEREERPRRSRSRGGRGRSERSTRGGGRRARDTDEGEEETEEAPAAAAPAEERVAEGVVELLGNGSGFIRVSPPDPSDDDVYISAAQVRRCELVSGDRVAGPVRAPRRSERYPSLVRIDTINGSSADEVAEGTHFDDLPAAWPTQRLTLGTEDSLLADIDGKAPLGRGSRAVITGPAWSGKSEVLRRIARAVVSQEELDVSVVLAGVRPEELTDWTAAGVEAAATLTFAASADAQSQAVERAVETAKRLASRGGNAVVLIDGLAGLPPAAARRVLAAARDIPEGGSLTIVATAPAPLGGETVLIALDAKSTVDKPKLATAAAGGTGTLRADLLGG